MLAREFDYPYFAELSNSIIWSIRQYAADSRGLITSCWMNAKGDTESEKLSNMAISGRLRFEPTSDFKVYILSNTILYCNNVGSTSHFLNIFN